MSLALSLSTVDPHGWRGHANSGHKPFQMVQVDNKHTSLLIILLAGREGDASSTVQSRTSTSEGQRVVELLVMSVNGFSNKKEGDN